MNNPSEAASLIAEFDTHWMTRAIEQASIASSRDEVPVGAVIIREGELVAEACNAKESLRDPTAHAEMIAITQACAAVDDWRLHECTLYVTLEPCVMCAGAILQSRIGRVVFGAADPKAGGVVSLYRLLEDARMNHRCMVTSGVSADSCGRMLTEFFQNKRAMGKK